MTAATFIRSIESIITQNAKRKKGDQVWLFGNEEATRQLLVILERCNDTSLEGS